jgi:hypothetical protein
MSAENLIKRRAALAKDIQTQSEALAKAVTELILLDSKIYQSLQKPDCLFNDSPISPLRTMTNFRKYLAKLGFGWAINLQFGTPEVKPFVEEMKDGTVWARRFSEEGVNRLV